MTIEQIPGKLRGLQATSTPQGVFAVLALDHGASLATTMQPAAPESISHETLARFKGALLPVLAPQASAVLLDPVYGLPPAVFDRRLPGASGLLLSLEDGDYAAPREQARVLDGWSVAQMKRAGANAAKFFFYYHPERREEAAVQEALLEQVVRACRSHDLPLFAEPLTYDTDPATRQRVVVHTARRLSTQGVDVLKLEFPLDVRAEADEAVWADACRELSAACGVPWVLLSAGVDYDTFRRQVRVACEAGASGFVAGRAIWKEAAGLQGEALHSHLRQTTVARLQQLRALATRLARPWPEFYAQQLSVQQMPAADWYRHYAQPN